jgi:hypothetical protein
MPPQETGKQRAARIPLDYYKHADVLESWKLRLGGLAMIVTLTWVGLHFALSEQPHFHASRGSVASVHQAWDAQCSACHADFTPISSHSWAPPFLRDPADSNRCQACHDGPEHHAGQKPDLTCGSCHREHRGPEASLVNLPDSDCTQCHKDLGNHMDVSKAWHLKAGEREIDKKVPGFAEKRHPEFRSIAKDPGKLKFNHKRHLSAGMVLEKDGMTGGGVKTLGDIPDAFRERYRDEQENKKNPDLVQLKCASCHQLDAGDFGVTAQQAQAFPFSVQGQRGAGAYMLPIVYENQCQACHPLEHKLPAEPRGKKLTIPHRLAPDKIHDLLSDFFTAQYARGLPGFLERKITRPFPFKLTPEEQEKIHKEVYEKESDLYVGKDIVKKIQNVKREVFLGNQSCALCHYFEGPKGKNLINLAGEPNLTVVPTKVPQVWFQHAKFNHAAHRAVKCESCHGKAANSTSHLDVLIPDLDNCVKCHAPKSAAGTPGARFNCTECHRYHNGDHDAQGVGAAKRNPKERRSFESFMRGK